jgi:tetratricopeptide (TPR) repeat protein
VSTESVEIGRSLYQTGKLNFENGQYREAVENLEKARALLSANSCLGGEVQIWLVTAYEAAGRTEEAIALCQHLQRHPFPETSKQAKRLIYILKAPKLQRPSEWMTQIPDLGALSDNDTKIRASGSPRQSTSKAPAEPKFVDLTQVNTKDNRFIGVALIVILFTFLYLAWLSF